MTNVLFDIWKRNYHSIYRYIQKRTRDSVLTDELMQTTLIKAWRAESPMITTAYLRTVAQSAINQHYRSQMRRHVLVKPESDLIDDDRLDAYMTIHPASAESSIYFREIMKFVEMIDEPGRSTLLAFAIDGLSYQEIAEQMNIKVGTVQSRISRAREELMDRLTYPNDQKKSGYKKSRIHYSQLDKEALRRDRQENHLTFREIADKYNLGNSDNAYQLMLRWGIHQSTGDRNGVRKTGKRMLFKAS